MTHVFTLPEGLAELAEATGGEVTDDGVRIPLVSVISDKTFDVLIQATMPSRITIETPDQLTDFVDPASELVNGGARLADALGSNAMDAAGGMFNVSVALKARPGRYLLFHNDGLMVVEGDPEMAEDEQADFGQWDWAVEESVGVPVTPTPQEDAASLMKAALLILADTANDEHPAFEKGGCAFEAIAAATAAGI